MINELGPTGDFRCPKCKNSLQNSVVGDKYRCANCKHDWKPTIVDWALKIATEAHIYQKRKWATGTAEVPYIVHPIRVAKKIATLKGTTEVDVAAALVHDLAEDVAIPQKKVAEYNQLVEEKCGKLVLELMWETTNPTEGPEWADVPRTEKRKHDWQHLAQVSDRAKRIKMVDRWDNVSDFGNAPSRLVFKYIPESYHLLSMTRYVDEEMGQELEDAIKALEKRYKHKNG